MLLKLLLEFFLLLVLVVDDEALAGGKFVLFLLAGLLLLVQRLWAVLDEVEVVRVLFFFRLSFLVEERGGGLGGGLDLCGAETTEHLHEGAEDLRLGVVEEREMAEEGEEVFVGEGDLVFLCLWRGLQCEP